ncbi:lipid kinase [Kaistia dalseonensis]|uniref:YegS/Rv2252/BmrU family lipid kinase n=1 Tax=Kaistia dalseonensis TaxID=410840 RepID=A0ABU0H119_9HYPH|nr:lipid kinase [Kaistia dalseonensis]MCX5493447.1 lipid kinase [Kaistia dalseonensis]MDQ0436006.1 YegS/Rv2252/BmrU family lipid kinase [Kaistia dalseonensis]
MTPKRALFLVNRKARNGGSDIQAIIDLLKEGGVELAMPEGFQPGEIADLIRDHRDKVDAVIVGGGDGSLNASARGLLATGLPLGILPLGTANDLARTLELPKDPLAAAKLILEGHTRQIDLGSVNDHPFFNVASIGFSAHLARGLTSEAKKRWGVFGYALGAMRILSQSRPFTATIEHDGKIEPIRTIQVSVGNGRYYGGGMTVEANAKPDDGRLDVYSLELGHWSEILQLLPRLRAGTHGEDKRVRAFDTTELTIQTRRRHEVNADGELVTTTPARFTLLRRAVTVFAPAT